MIPNSNTTYAIGIDLGTTYCCVALYVDNKCKILINECGKNITPSYVSFTADGDILVGDAAKDHAVFNPTNTIYGTKRLIGRSIDDSEIQTDLNCWPFKVSEVDNLPLIHVQHNKKEKLLSPEEVAGMLLKKMRKIAEEYTGQCISNAVITVPAYFNNSQRQATKDAGKLAGLNVLRVLSEPTAAALAFGFETTHGSKNKKVFVYDLGGGTFDTSVLSIDSANYHVLSTGGNTHLGGEDFDQMLLNFCIDKFFSKHNVNLFDDKRAVRRLLTACEKAKRALSSVNRTVIELDSIHSDLDFSLGISRTRFEDLCDDLFKNTIDITHKTLSDANLSVEDIDDIVLVGGSTRIPKVLELVTNYFNKTPSRVVNPDEAVASGAALHAYRLINADSLCDEIMEINLFDVTPLSLGVQVRNGNMSIIIPKGSKLPVTKSKIYTNVIDNQSKVAIEIFEGERIIAKDNYILGKFDFNGLTPSKRGHSQISIEFSVNENGILSLKATDITSNTNMESTIHRPVGRLSESDINRILDEAKRFEENDKKVKSKIDCIIDLENYIYTIRDLSRCKTISLDEESKLSALFKVELDWFDEFNDVSDKYELERHLEDLKMKVKLIVSRPRDIFNDN